MIQSPIPRAATPKHAVIVAHPEPESFTLSVARAYCDAVEARGQRAVLRDLYRLRFDPVLKAAERPTGAPFIASADVQAELDALAGADVFVLVYPVWFGAPPAMIKGYVERVFGAGLSEPLGGIHRKKPSHKLLGGKRLLSITSSGSTKRWLDEQGAWLSLQTLFDGYLARAFWMNTPDHLHFDAIIPGIDPAAVRARLAEVEARAAQTCMLIERERAAAPAEAS